MITRRIGKILRGKAKPSQVMLATVLAGMLGFVPGFLLPSDLGGGFLQAPGLILALLFLVLACNANLALFGIVLLVAKLLSFALLPVSFALGRFLLDGPTQGLFRALVNAPVLAWFGLEHYATSGGLLLGLVFGVLTGWLAVRSLRAFRTAMAAAEQGSGRFQAITGKRPMRLLTWVFLGSGKGKMTYRELLASGGKGLPFRVGGLVTVLVLGGLSWLGHSFLTGSGLRAAARSGLESWNGATVDLEQASVDLTSGEVKLAGLGMADPQALELDGFRAGSLELKIDTGGLLRRRFVIDRIASRDASRGQPRATPGRLVVREEPPPQPPPEPGSRTLEDYLKEAEVWRGRLQQLSRWLEQLSGGDDPAPEATPEERAAKIEQQARELGFVRVYAAHLIEGVPSVLVREIALEGVSVADLPGELVDVRARNVSTAPRLVREPMEVTVAARSGAFSFSFNVDAAGARAARTAFALKGLKVDDVMAKLREVPVRGGTMDLSLSGTLDCAQPGGARIDLPLHVRLFGSTLSLPGLKPAAVSDLTVPLGLRGPLASPRVRVDDKALADALLAAGQRELADQVRSKAEQLLKDKVPGGLGETPDQALEQAKQKAAEEAKKLVPGLFGGKKGG